MSHAYIQYAIGVLAVIGEQLLESLPICTSCTVPSTFLTLSHRPQAAAMMSIKRYKGKANAVWQQKLSTVQVKVRSSALLCSTSFSIHSFLLLYFALLCSALLCSCSALLYSTLHTLQLCCLNAPPSCCSLHLHHTTGML
jgi:hypothetical protein